MKRISVIALILVTALSTDTASAAKKKRAPAPPPTAQALLEFSDANVNAAINRGVEFLWSQRQADGSWPPLGGYPVGPSAMAIYSLLESGVSVQDPRIVESLEWLKKDTDKTYELGMRAQAWLAAMRKGGQYRKELIKDVERLRASTANGSYNYTSNADGKSSGDNSNSQIGLLGVWAGALANLEIPVEYWQKVLVHWLNSQNADGGWVYSGGGGGQNSATAMTAAGVASLFVCYDNLFVRQFGGCDVGDKGRLVHAPIKRGLDWFDKNFAASMEGRVNMGHSDLVYYLYAVERVGLASGYKYFDTADWYKIAATKLIRSQQPNGAWAGSWSPTPSTSFALLFLIRGCRPVMFNKLEFDGDWNNRPRDMAYLAQWMTGQVFEREVFWQIINLKVPPREWHDAPVLYLSGALEPKFSDEDLAKLREYVWQGGTIFSVTACQGKGFETGIRKYYEKMFPELKLTKCDREHLLYNIHNRLPDSFKGEFYVISNGVRPLVIHTDADLARSWQLHQERTNANDFGAASNVLKYVTNFSFRPRGAMLWPAEEQVETPTVVKLARLKFDGNWDPEPLAYQRFSRLMASEYATKVDVIPDLTIDKLAGSGAKVATLTGTGELQLSEEQQKALRDFVEDGGILVVDAAGGNEDFDRSARAVLAKAFSNWRMSPIKKGNPLLQLQDMVIEKAQYRSRTKDRIRSDELSLSVIMVDDRPGVIYSREDITGGLVGYQSYTCDGYNPESAFEIMRNVVTYAGEGPAAASQPSIAPAAPAPAK